MDIQNAVEAILEQKEYSKAKSLLDSQKDMTSEHLLPIAKKTFSTDFLSKSQEYIIQLLMLLNDYDVKLFDVYYHFLSNNDYYKDEKRRTIIGLPVFINALVISISNKDELQKLEELFFNDGIDDDARVVILNVIQFFCLSVTKQDKAASSMLSETMKHKNNFLIDYFNKVVDWINKWYNCCNCDSNKIVNANTNTNKHIALFCVIKIIAEHYYNNDYRIDYKNVSSLVTTIVNIITTSEIDYNLSLFREYFKLLKLLSPKIFCDAIEVSDYIRNIPKSLHKISIFDADSLERVGQIIYHKILDDNDCSDDILKLAIQIVRRYPFNNRNKPRNNDDYYIELVGYLNIKLLPFDSLKIARDEYNNVKKELESLIERINLLEQKCDKKEKELKEKIDTLKLKYVKKNNRILFNDLSPTKKMLLIDHQNLKELEALYCTKEVPNSYEETGADSYLEYCKKYLFNNFALFVDGQNTKGEVDEKLKQWALWDACKDHDDALYDSVYNIKERFIPYLNALKQFNELIDEDPVQTIKRLRLRVKTFMFIENYIDKHKKISGEKLSDDSSKEYTDFIKDLEKQPFYLDNIMNINESSEYLKLQKQLVTDAVKRIKTDLERSSCLKKRRKIIEKILSLFTEEEYDSVINMIPIQIEGLFADYLDNSLAFKSEKDLYLYENIYDSVLRKKASMIEINDLNLGFDTIGYFKYYFNSVYRNTVAHGNYWLLLSGYIGDDNNTFENSNEILAHDLILDLNYIVHVIVNSNEIDEAKRYLSYTIESLCDSRNDDTVEMDSTDDVKEDLELLELSKQDVRYERLYLDLLGESRFNLGGYKKGVFITYDPVQLLYWIFNPLIESAVGDEICFCKIREVLYSQDFWKYVEKKLRRGLILNDGHTLITVIKLLIPLFQNKQIDINSLIEVNILLQSL